MVLLALIQIALALVFAPLLLGAINRTKAWFGGRCGAPIVQPYYDLARLLRKGAVYSRTTTWLFRAGPLVGLGAVLAVAALVPLGRGGALIAFPGDFVLAVYLLGLARLFTVLAALDTGSAFEGMGASREATFGALAEPVLFLALIAVGRTSGSFSLSAMVGGLSGETWRQAGLVLGLVAVALFIVLLAENCRVPVDDPNTHLELTMIHEVMVLDHSGPDFAFILYGAALKLWIFASVVVQILIAALPLDAWSGLAAHVLGVLALGVIVGVIESSVARLRMLRIPHLLVGAGALAVLALVLGAMRAV